MNKNFSKIVIGVMLFFTITNSVVFARSSSDIAKDISNQQKQLNANQKALDQAKKNLDYYNNVLDDSSEGLPQIKAELKQLEAEISYNKKQLTLLNGNKELKELEKVQRELQREASLKSSYVNWRSRTVSFGKVLETQKDYDFKKNQQYSNLILNDQQKNIFGLTSELQNINADINDYQSTKDKLDKANAKLSKKKKALEDAIKYYSSAIGYTVNSVSSLQTNIKKTKQSISQLSSEQSAAIQREIELLNQDNPLGGSVAGCNITNAAAGGSFYFCGLGRDLYQGHGVGMSQWGAHGMGQKGLSASQILKIYFTGVVIAGGYPNSTITIKENYGNGNIVTRNIKLENFVAGQAEVPKKACGSSSQASANPAKYATSGCWPETTIEAQVIAYRTYVLRYIALHGNFPVCYAPAYIAGTCSTSTVAYDDSTATKWAADETAGKAITYNGNLIEAVYSSDNSQGFGTANNDTIWQSYAGDGTVYPYLRAANDSQWATKTSWTTWGYKTRKYSLSSMNSFLDFIRLNKSGTLGGYSGLVSLAGTIKSKIVSTSSVTFERDPSNRIKKVWFHGSNGQQGAIGGYWFKFAWNEWVSWRDTNDFLYSQTFFVSH